MPYAPVHRPRALPAALLAALLVSLAGCGGGGGTDTQLSSGCSLHSTTGCGGSPPLPVNPPVPPPVTPPVTPP